MATFTPIAGARALFATTINANTDTWKIALTNTLPSTTAFTAGTTDLATGGGYTAGGMAATFVSGTETAGVYSLVLNSPAVLTATAANIGPFRYAVLVNSTINAAIAYWDMGVSNTLQFANADTLTLTLGSSVIQLT